MSIMLSVVVPIAVVLAIVLVPALLQLFAYWCYEYLPEWLYLLIGLVVVVIISGAVLLVLLWLFAQAA